jgi:sRNA-binding protein
MKGKMHSQVAKKVAHSLESKNRELAEERKKSQLKIEEAQKAAAEMLEARAAAEERKAMEQQALDFVRKGEDGTEKKDQTKAVKDVRFELEALKKQVWELIEGSQTEDAQRVADL